VDEIGESSLVDVGIVAFLLFQRLLCWGNDPTV